MRLELSFLRYFLKTKFGHYLGSSIIMSLVLVTNFNGLDHSYIVSLRTSNFFVYSLDFCFYNNFLSSNTFHFWRLEQDSCLCFEYIIELFFHFQHWTWEYAAYLFFWFLLSKASTVKQTALFFFFCTAILLSVFCISVIICYASSSYSLKCVLNPESPDTLYHNVFYIRI